MLKKIMAIILSSLVVLTIGVFADEQINFDGYNGVVTTNILFTGMGSDGLTGGDTVSAGISAVKEDGEPQKAVFVLALYDGTEMIDVKLSEEKEIGNASVSFEASLTLPGSAPAVKYELNASLINPDYGFDVLCNPAYYPTRDEQKMYPIKDILVDDKELSSYDKEKTSFDIEFSKKAESLSDYANGVFSQYYPEVKIKTVDLGTKVSSVTDGTYPGEMTVSAVASDNTSVENELDFKFRKHAIKGFESEESFAHNDYESYAPNAVTFLTETLSNKGPHIYSDLHGNSDLYSTDPSAMGSRAMSGDMWQGQRCQVLYVDPLIEGLDYFFTYGEWNALKPTGNNLAEFEVTSDVVVNIITDASVAFDGFTKDTANKIWMKRIYMNSPYYQAFEALGLEPFYGFYVDYTENGGVYGDSTEEKVQNNKAVIDALLETEKYAYIKEAFDAADDEAKAKFYKVCYVCGDSNLFTRNYRLYEIPEGETSLKITIPNYNGNAAVYGPYIIIEPVELSD